ncbi:MAG: signal peptidase I [Butyrivibrio sp.]|nr:signal peptidase I [Butyrivibrio sp.]
MRAHRRRMQEFSFREKKKILTPELVREILSWIVYTLIAIFFAFVFVTAFGLRLPVSGGSMSPVLENGDGVLVDRLVYRVVDPVRGDVVAFQPNGNQKSHYYIKRVMAVPGDRVQIKNGVLYVNGEADLEDAMARGTIQDAGIAEKELVLGEDEYFVMGDERSSGEDSRSANVGPIAQSLIVGRCWFRLGREESGLIR